MTDERHVLVIFPHPDDETFSSAGTIASYIDAGVPVTYACLTLGQMGRNLGNPPLRQGNLYLIFENENLKMLAEQLELQT